MASTYLSRSISSSGSTTKGTLSVWVKKTSIASGYPRIWTSYVNGTDWIEVYFDNVDRLATYCQVGGSTKFHFVTTRKFRDTNGFYHIVVAFDSTQATASNRVKMYVNGVQETAFDTNTNNTSQNDDLKFNKSSNTDVIGRYVSGSNNYFDGQMSHLHWIDGTAYTPSTFGSTDATTGEWKINTSPTLTMGTNGFTILKDGMTITDQSSNSNNFSLGGGTLTKTEDCPDNVFATWNKLDWGTTYFTLTNGSTTAQSNASVFTYGVSTLGVNSGKFYWEVEYDAKNGGNRFPQIGITSTQTTNTQYELGHYANDWCYYTNDTTGKLRNNNADNNWGTYYQEGDIIGVALDLDNNKLYFSKNGTWQESGDPSAGNNGISITAPSSTPLGFYFPAICYYDSTYRGTFKANFGNGYFGTTAVSSNSGNGYSGTGSLGIFQYQPPTGYTTLSTKGLNI